MVNLYKYLVDEKKEYVMSKQLLRSGTSIGANISETISAESSADFVHKLSIAQKEANETIYWLALLEKTGYLSGIQHGSMSSDCTEIRKILVSSILTSKQRCFPINHKS
ncbi:four helix bundle protein [Bacteroides salyersiae]|nr:four helix bundle protein [Bacteroides salyersiae]